jgi:pimeloyl-ACP methyl ester carboxylesterase
MAASVTPETPPPPHDEPAPVAASPELFAPVSTGVELCYRTYGDPTGEPMMLLMGLASPLTWWDPAFCSRLARHGYFVITPDNRDVGRSTKVEGRVSRGMLVRAFAGAPVRAPYSLTDMSRDALGLLDHLGIERAHILGASMGGMIVQAMAIEHPTRIRSLISVMSMPGDFDYGRPAPEAAAVLFAAPPTDRDEFIAASEKSLVFQSKKYGDAIATRERSAASYDRMFYPQGAPRQLAAIYADGDRSERLRALTVPTLVIHGRDDTLIGPDGGMRTAELIPGANLLLLADMGHDMPEPLWPVLVDAILSHTAHAP